MSAGFFCVYFMTENIPLMSLGSQHWLGELNEMSECPEASLFRGHWWWRWPHWHRHGWVNRQRFATVQQWQVGSPKAVSFCGSCETLLSWEQVRVWRISLWILTWVSWPHDATAEQQMDHLIVRYHIHHDVLYLSQLLSRMSCPSHR